MALPDRLASALSHSYRLGRELGAGGMATVYLAEDLTHHRQVAIKVLRPELAAVIGAERFLAEIRTTSRGRCWPGLVGATPAYQPESRDEAPYRLDPVRDQIEL